MQRLDESLGLMQTLRDHCGGPESTLKGALIKAGFPYKDMDKKVAVLSGGERARLMFLIIRMNQPNFLILDEPTNHIDIQSKEELEAQILETNATVLITSHDRRFVDNIAERYVLISEDRLTEINRPEIFYNMDSPDRSRQEQQTDGDISEPEGEEEILARIIELEALLEADLARKPKFQKPKLQESWRAEIDSLSKSL